MRSGGGSTDQQQGGLAQSASDQPLKSLCLSLSPFLCPYPIPFPSHRRFFVLHRSQLYYFVSEDQVAAGPSAAKGSVIVSGASLRPLERSAASGRACAIGLLPMAGKKEYILVPESEESRSEWMVALKKAGAHFREDNAAGDRELGSTPASPTSTSSLLSLFPPVLSSLSPRMFSTSILEGWLLKSGGVSKKLFQARYFVLVGGKLMYFENCPPEDNQQQQQQQPTPKGEIDLRDCMLQKEGDVDGSSSSSDPFTGSGCCLFSLTPHQKSVKRSSLFSSLFGEVRKQFVMVAREHRERREWMQQLQKE